MKTLQLSLPPISRDDQEMLCWFELMFAMLRETFATWKYQSFSRLPEHTSPPLASPLQSLVTSLCEIEEKLSRFINIPLGSKWRCRSETFSHSKIYFLSSFNEDTRAVEECKREISLITRFFKHVEDQADEITQMREREEARLLTVSRLKPEIIFYYPPRFREISSKGKEQMLV